MSEHPYYYKLIDPKNNEEQGRGYCYADAYEICQQFMYYWGYALIIEEC